MQRELENNKKADLHVHTFFSDGTFSPEEVVLEARKRKIDCIGVCDHDCVEGVEEALKVAEREGVEVVPGIELTAERGETEIHILGYYIDWKKPSLLGLAKRMQEARVNRIHQMVKKLKENKVDIDPEDVFKISGKGSVGRLHLAHAIHNKGYTRYPGEAFRLYIGNSGPCYVGKFNLTAVEAITAILKADGIPVLAHPGVIGQDKLIPQYVKNGLMGIEVYHSDHSPATVSNYMKLAEELGILVTGGSDCHGLGKGKVLMGKITVDYSHVEKLKKAVGKL